MFVWTLIVLFRVKDKLKSYDPIDYECLDQVDVWINEEAPPELNDEDLNIGNVIYDPNHATPIIEEVQLAKVDEG